ncbi:MAG: ATP-dependent zinc protease [Myxococcales bacterium]|nr:ATP-dependent zinc protease [Myxococcales bacterium]
MSSSLSPRRVPGVPERAGALVVIGYLERVALPGWGVTALTAKVDTGADTSALHVDDLRAVGSTRVAFRVGGDDGATREVQARIARRGWVRCSSGEEEERVFVRTALSLGGKTRVVELGLVDRSRMQQRMLLGRSALEGWFLVDPSRTFSCPPGLAPVGAPPPVT